MNAHQVLNTLHDAGLSIALAPDQGLKVTPASRLTPELRDLIRTSKIVLTDLLERMNSADDCAAPWRVSVAPGASSDVLARLRAASLALDRKQASLPIEPPDAWCWPHSSAMNGAEIDTFLARVNEFIEQGLSLNDAEHLADKLVIRDREGEDRHVCLECAHLRQDGGWRCGNCYQACVATRAKEAWLPEAVHQLLQRCPGYKPRS